MTAARELAGLAPVSAWTSLPLTSDFTASSGMTPQYRVSGDCVQFRGRVISNLSLTSGVSIQFATMPAGSRTPFNQQSTIAPVATNGVALMVAITTGVLNILPYANFSAGQAFDINSNYYFL